ncbi:hypothetical protein GCM10010260_76820 [Streptomyces filipinensis]|uniref:Uncharacterized protein n=1 Tax=Streptomyces filipinensis TaxID=66887 RepID=A0A918IJ62_9ACTN|nr:hypothetical protein [Streptomyces filipinensis]GGV25110.1 hypothetical protein GCM10010260_76820 [Streptomyces filipinensis]
MRADEGLLPAATAGRADRGRPVTASAGLLPVAARRAALRPARADKRTFSTAPAADRRTGGGR